MTSLVNNFKRRKLWVKFFAEIPFKRDFLEKRDIMEKLVLRVLWCSQG